jgi:hypothetical protein
MDAFDADVLIYAAFRVHPLGSRVAALFPPSPVEEGTPAVGIGSVLLISELLTKPLRDEAEKRSLRCLGCSRVSICGPLM